MRTILLWSAHHCIAVSRGCDLISTVVTCYLFISASALQGLHSESCVFPNLNEDRQQDARTSASASQSNDSVVPQGQRSSNTSNDSNYGRSVSSVGSLRSTHARTNSSNGSLDLQPHEEQYCQLDEVAPLPHAMDLVRRLASRRSKDMAIKKLSRTQAKNTSVVSCASSKAADTGKGNTGIRVLAALVNTKPAERNTPLRTSMHRASVQKQVNEQQMNERRRRSIAMRYGQAISKESSLRPTLALESGFTQPHGVAAGISGAGVGMGSASDALQSEVIRTSTTSYDNAILANTTGSAGTRSAVPRWPSLPIGTNTATPTMHSAHSTATATATATATTATGQHSTATRGAERGGSHGARSGALPSVRVGLASSAAADSHAYTREVARERSAAAAADGAMPRWPSMPIDFVRPPTTLHTAPTAMPGDYVGLNTVPGALPMQMLPAVNDFSAPTFSSGQFGDAGATKETRSRESAPGWPSALLGDPMATPTAGLLGEASLDVVAAGGVRDFGVLDGQVSRFRRLSSEGAETTHLSLNGAVAMTSFMPTFFAEEHVNGAVAMASFTTAPSTDPNVRAMSESSKPDVHTTAHTSYTATTPSTDPNVHAMSEYSKPNVHTTAHTSHTATTPSTDPNVQSEYSEPDVHSEEQLQGAGSPVIMPTVAEEHLNGAVAITSFIPTDAEEHGYVPASLERVEGHAYPQDASHFRQTSDV